MEDPKTTEEPKVNETEEKEIKKEKRQVFWIRFCLYFIFGVVIPCGFLIWRFDLFKVVNKMQTNVWTIVLVCFILGFFLNIAKQVRKGLRFSMLTQCLDGIIKIMLPLLIAIICIYLAKDCMEEIMEFLIVVFICEVVAIPMNPFPQWCYEHELENDLFNIKRILNSFKEVDKKDDTK